MVLIKSCTRGCMRQVLRAGALGRPRGMGWGGRREGGSGWGAHVNPWRIHVSVWQKPLQYCKVISLQLIKTKKKNKQEKKAAHEYSLSPHSCSPKSVLPFGHYEPDMVIPLPTWGANGRVGMSFHLSCAFPPSTDLKGRGEGREKKRKKRADSTQWFPGTWKTRKLTSPLLSHFRKVIPLFCR